MGLLSSCSPFCCFCCGRWCCWTFVSFSAGFRCNRPGTTHKREWDQFCRAAANRSKFPVALSEQFVQGKTELFNLWMDSGKSWDQTVVQVKRKQELEHKATKGWEAVRGSDLRKRYSSEEKFTKVVNARKASGLYYEDEDFPGDLDDSHRIYLGTFYFLVVLHTYDKNITCDIDRT